VCQSKESWFLQIEKEIYAVRLQLRPVQVYFESLTLLEAFYARPNVKQISPLRLDERQSPEGRRAAVQRAVANDTVTLLTRDFGRGTNFVCSDPKIDARGGVHVLQTFVSDEISEEKQIQRAFVIEPPSSFIVVADVTVVSGVDSRSHRRLLRQTRSPNFVIFISLLASEKLLSLTATSCPTRPKRLLIESCFRQLINLCLSARPPLLHTTLPLPGCVLIAL
jgi:hypothetical protein